MNAETLDLIDAGANLTHPSFSDDLPEVMARALSAGVSTMIITGTSVQGSAQAIALAQAHPARLYATVGMHPHEAKDFDQQTIARLKSLLSDPKVVAVGECGLDFNRNYSPHLAQEDCFEAQLELAAQEKMPLFLHERDAHERFLAILKHHRERLAGVVVHCFTGNRVQARAYLDQGCLLGITGWICDERRGEDLRDACRYIPLEGIMLETDSPYLLPRTMQPKPKDRRNEPSSLPWVARMLAQCTDCGYEEVVATSSLVAREFFRIPS